MKPLRFYCAAQEKRGMKKKKKTWNIFVVVAVVSGTVLSPCTTSDKRRSLIFLFDISPSTANVTFQNFGVPLNFNHFSCNSI